MKEKTLAFCRKIYLAVKQYDKDEDDDEYKNITIVDEVPYELVHNMNRIQEQLRNELPRLRSENRVQLLYRVIDKLPLRCNDCGHIQNRLAAHAIETRTDTIHGTCDTSAWMNEEGDYHSSFDNITDTDTGDSDIDEFNAECSDCGSGYDTDNWTVAVPRNLADDIFYGAQLVSGKKPKPLTTGPKKPAILNQFSEIKHRPQLEYDPYDNADEGVGVPFGESMEKLLG